MNRIRLTYGDGRCSSCGSRFVGRRLGFVTRTALGFLWDLLIKAALLGCAAVAIYFENAWVLAAALAVMMLIPLLGSPELVPDEKDSLTRRALKRRCTA